MAFPRQAISFSQDTCGGHRIRVSDLAASTGKPLTEKILDFNINGLDVEGLREVINGLANILSSVSARMYQLEIKPEYRK